MRFEYQIAARPHRKSPTTILVDYQNDAERQRRHRAMARSYTSNSSTPQIQRRYVCSPSRPIAGPLGANVERARAAASLAQDAVAFNGTRSAPFIRRQNLSRISFVPASSPPGNYVTLASAGWKLSGRHLPNRWHQRSASSPSSASRLHSERAAKPDVHSLESSAARPGASCSTSTTDVPESVIMPEVTAPGRPDQRHRERCRAASRAPAIAAAQGLRRRQRDHSGHGRWRPLSRVKSKVTATGR